MAKTVVIDGVSYVPLEDYKTKEKEATEALVAKIKTLDQRINNKKEYLNELDKKISKYEDRRTEYDFERRAVTEILLSFKRSDNDILQDVVTEAEKAAEETYNNRLHFGFPTMEFREFVMKYLDRCEGCTPSSWEKILELEEENTKLKRENTRLRKERGFITKNEQASIKKAMEVIATIMERSNETEEENHERS